MKPGRNLQIGDEALTDYNHIGTPTRVTIIDRSDRQRSQSGILFRVRPTLRNGRETTWYDADWFWPVNQASEQVPQQTPDNTP
jgi:hypothetical protein